MANELSRIEKEFILKTLFDSETRLELHSGTDRTACVITEVRPEGITAELHGSIHLNPGREITLYFRFRGNPMMFRTRVVAVEESSVRIQSPEDILRDLSRSYERISAPAGIGVSFTVDGRKVELNYPKSDQFDPVEEPVAAAGFDASRIAELLKSFRERSREFASENKIVMFRERKPTMFEERTIAASGKILTLPFVAPETMGLSRTVRERMLTQSEVVEAGASIGLEVFRVLENLSNITERQKKDRVAGELYCPLLYHQYVVGYLYLLRTEKYREPFEAKTLEFVFQFARVLSFSLKANGYFTAEPVREEFSGAELLDISGSGLLACYPQSGPVIHVYSDLDIIVTVGRQKIRTKGRVLRRYTDSERVYLGLKFLDMELKDMQLLFKTLYGEEYSGDVDQQGAADLSRLSETDK